MQEPIINVGNLNSVRTICDVRDMVKAYYLAMKYGKVGDVYNIGGNATMTVGEYLFLMLELVFGKGKKPVIHIDPQLLRPADVTLQIPCIDKFLEITDWEPKISVDKTLLDTVDYWKDELIKNPWKLNTLIK